MWFLRLRKFLKSAGKDAIMLAIACRHPATPTFVKIGTLLLAIYAVSPVDLVPDVPLVGWLDDAALLMISIPFLLKRVPTIVRQQALESTERLLAKFGGRSTTAP